MCNSGITLDEYGNLIHERSGEILKIWCDKPFGHGHFIDPEEVHQPIIVKKYKQTIDEKYIKCQFYMTFYCRNRCKRKTKGCGRLYFYLSVCNKESTNGETNKHA